jgi:hypothetical protein
VSFYKKDFKVLNGDEYESVIFIMMFVQECEQCEAIEQIIEGIEERYGPLGRCRSSY